jgi:predicted dehydrogenase
MSIIDNGEINTTIIGAGSIGALKPDKYDTPGGKNVLTHAHALHRDDRFRTLAILDTDDDKAEKAAEKWGLTQSLDDIWCDRLVKEETVVLVVAAPTENHHEIILRAIAEMPKLRVIVLEKPAGMSSQQCEAILATAQQADITVIVNYTRRFVHDLRQIRFALSRGVYGTVYAAELIYGRGLKREASHALDFFNSCFGFPEVVKLLWGGWADYTLHDPSPGVFLSYGENCPHVTLTPVPAPAYSIFEMVFHTKKGILKLMDNGATFRHYTPVDEPVYGNYPSVRSDKYVEHKIKLTEALPALYDNVYDVVNNNDVPWCTLQDAMLVHNIYNRLETNLNE